ncbi:MULTISPECIES: tetratricopeptide repeat protein [unclassified Anabaena]|uniref:tetratricopeptide repeat protein n=1 Tax=unclassified Anabaena TaxID=2619674 RepID=UPI00144891D5|nr:MULTISPECIES: tetratricopeptide repeat protein [unclassified Anabaena]MTJ08975.1 tetratricopeptide repeat protein [Anabaena sp. UHCC 0204]MTJ51826.1 tetratricopeptide repeat protein [Anabaena sp. UHCC 0253]
MNNEFYHRGLEKAQQKNYAGAIEDFNAAIQENPNFSKAYIQRGLAYYDSGAILQAVDDYSKAIKLDELSVEAFYCRALARLTLKNLPGTLDDVEKVIRLNPLYAAAYDLRGMVRRKQGYIQEAIANFKKAAELYLEQKDKDKCYSCLEKIKQLQSPEKSIQPVTKSAPESIISTNQYFQQLLAKAEQGETSAAIADLNWVLKADPNDAQAYCCRGVVQCKLGNYHEAIADFNHALQLNFQDGIVYRNRGKARSQIGDYQGALSDLNQALQKQPEDPLVYVARGNIYRSMSDYLKAIQDYSQALQLNPNYAPAYYHRGLVYTLLEEIQNAISDYQKAVSIYCEQEDWENYQQVLNSLQKIQTSNPEIKNQKYQILRQRLLRLVGGQQEIANRLIQQQEYNYPGMSDDWYLQKVIDQLERDRQ